MSKNTLIRITVYGFLFLGISMYFWGRSIWHPVYIKINGKETTQSIYSKIGPQIEPKLKKYFKDQNLNFPTDKICLIAIKDEQILEIWSEGKLIKTYPFTGYSGDLGPKLKSGDGQIPEGLYNIEYLNPNSSYHLSMKISYPNSFDQQVAQNENRSYLGGDIFIHGNSVTIGCIPIGNKNIEELFILAHKTGKNNIDVIITPVDFRKNDNTFKKNDPKWLIQKYKRIKNALIKYKS